ncbi:MAG: hypothetical protein ABSA48_12450 [Terracidiphilus sp.]|jgi:hypothetical protein
MSRYIMIRRLRAPAFLLLVGVLALLAQAHILGWTKSWPLFLILAGVLALAERTVLPTEEGYPPYPDPIDPRAATGIPPYPGQPTAFIPPHLQDYEKDPFERKS